MVPNTKGIWLNVKRSPFWPRREARTDWEPARVYLGHNFYAADRVDWQIRNLTINTPRRRRRWRRRRRRRWRHWHDSFCSVVFLRVRRRAFRDGNETVGTMIRAGRFWRVSLVTRWLLSKFGLQALKNADMFHSKWCSWQERKWGQ